MDKERANGIGADDSGAAIGIGAAVDIGSNSIHVLVAQPGRVAVLDTSRLLGLGDLVDTHGAIPDAARREILATLAEYVELAHAAAARQVTLIGTEPLRRATNAPAVAAEVSSVTGLPLHIVSSRVEAELTFLGATAGTPPSRPTIVVDIGGGSTEIGIHRPGVPFLVVGLGSGSARLTNAIVEHDPPTTAELARLHRAVRRLSRELPSLPHSNGELWQAIFVGGTATNLARLGALTRAGLAEDELGLARMSGAEIGEHFGVRPQRARQLAAGASIVEAILDQFALDEALVSQASLRDGAIIAAARFGNAWPVRLAEAFGQSDQPAAESATSNH